MKYTVAHDKKIGFLVWIFILSNLHNNHKEDKSLSELKVTVNECFTLTGLACSF
jgi:hypothetical protein